MIDSDIADLTAASDMVEMMPPFIGLAALLIIIGACSSKIAKRFNTPVLVMFLFIGMLVGENGILGIRFDNYVLANFVGNIAMAYILFSGGYDTDAGDVRRVFSRGTVLATAGVFLTAFLTAVCLYCISRYLFCYADTRFSLCMLTGSIVSSTDAAAVFSILRGRGTGLRGDLKPLLEYESGSNDPMAAFMTLLMLDIVRGDTVNWWMLIPKFMFQMGGGILCGVLVGKIAVRLFNRINFEYDGLYYVLGIGTVLLCFGTSGALGCNAFMAVYVCGIVMGNSKFIFQHGLGRFNDGISWLMQVMLFALLGLLVTPADLFKSVSVSGGVIIALVLMLIARPVSVFICMAGSRFTWQEKLLTAWTGLRGGAPIMLATFPLMYRIKYDWDLFNMVFCTVLLSVTFQGWSLMPLARRLCLDEPVKVKPRVPLEFENTGTLVNNDEIREYVIMPGSSKIGSPVSGIGLGDGALILLLRRGDKFVVPRGNTVLNENDALMIIGTADTHMRIPRLLS